MPLVTPISRGRLAAAIFLVSANLVLWEILLTRIFSTILYYHFAFMAVSVSMFGLTAGAVAVFLSPPSEEKLTPRMGLLAGLTAAVTALAISVQLYIPLVPDADGATPSSYLAATYVLSALPFVPGGAFICLALTRFADTGTLYAADLAGSALSCALMPLLIVAFNGPGAVWAAGAMSALAGAIVLMQSHRRNAAALAIAAIALTLAGQLNVSQQWLRVRYRHNGPSPATLYESWNAFSRIIVSPYWEPKPFSYGIAPAFLPGLPDSAQLWLEIDSGAATPITEFHGDLQKIDYLHLELCAIAHRMRENADVCIIGPGGGRDVLAALVFKQKSIMGIDVNPDILYAANTVFGDFSGHLDRRPDVTFMVDDGRSALTRTDKRFDIIQASFVDTVAATSAGAYAFTENGLYTVEGWKLFMQRLKPHGVVSFSRFYFGCANWPVEIYRLIALGAAALRESGVKDPAQHMLLFRVERGMATLLVSPDPFSPEDVERAKKAAAAIQCEIALGPGICLDEKFKILTQVADIAQLRAAFPLDITPTYDDRPYFFFHARIRDILAGTGPEELGGSSFNLPAVRILITLTITVLALGALLIVFPIVWLKLRGATNASSEKDGPAALPLYFATIGFAFMFVEIGLIQRLSLFLGHPIYGFTVVLFGLLLATGLGSFLSDRILKTLAPRNHFAILLCAAAVITLAEIVGVWALQTQISAQIASRIAVTLLLICPPAVLMGFAFPMGMDLSRRANDSRAAWFWSINGATSVMGSVLAMLFSIELGIRITMLAGAAIYLLAAALHRWGAGKIQTRGRGTDTNASPLRTSRFPDGRN